MSRARSHNYQSLNVDPPKETMGAFNAQSGDTKVSLSWNYSKGQQEEVDGYRIYYSAPTEGERYQDVTPESTRQTTITGLTNGTTYTFRGVAFNHGGESPAVTTSGTPKFPTIPAPVLNNVKNGDAKFTVEVKFPAPIPEGYTLTKLVCSLTDQETKTENLVDATGTTGTVTVAAPNGLAYDAKIKAIVAPYDLQSVWSNTVVAQPVAPIPPDPPYKPRITGAMQQTGLLCNFSWEPGEGPVLRDGPTDITKWEMTLDKGLPDQQVFTLNDGSKREGSASVKTYGEHTFTVRAGNANGWSPYATTVTLEVVEQDRRPFRTTDQYRGPDYNPKTDHWYVILDPGNDPSQGWTRQWKLYRTEIGEFFDLEAIVVSSGGGGKGTTATLGKGGDGGGGTFQVVQLPGQPEGTLMTVTLGIGGTTAIDPTDAKLNGWNVDVTVPSGKSATSGQDAAGTKAGVQVPEDWRNGFSVFDWYSPQSTFVGGVAQSGEQEYPNGMWWGQAGAGTKNAKPGQGNEGVVVIRWKDPARLAPKAKRRKWFRRG